MGFAILEGGGFMSASQLTDKFEWTSGDENNDLSQGGDAKFIIGGIFTRPIHLQSIADCRYIAEQIELAHRTGFALGKDSILHQLAKILNTKD